MKRYEIYFEDYDEDSNGQWVKWEDVEPILDHVCLNICEREKPRCELCEIKKAREEGE